MFFISVALLRRLLRWSGERCAVGGGGGGGGGSRVGKVIKEF